MTLHPHGEGCLCSPRGGPVTFLIQKTEVASLVLSCGGAEPPPALSLLQDPPPLTWGGWPKLGHSHGGPRLPWLGPPAALTPTGLLLCVKTPGPPTVSPRDRGQPTGAASGLLKIRVQVQTH